MDLLAREKQEIILKLPCYELQKGLKNPQNRVFLLRQNTTSKDVVF